MEFRKYESLESNDNFAEQLKGYLKYWPFFVLALVVSIGTAFIYILYSTPQYKITSTLLIQDDEKGDGLLKGTAFSDLNMFRSSKTVDNEMEVLRSRDLIYKVLGKLGMDVELKKPGQFRDKILYGKTSPITIVPYKLDKPAYAKDFKLSVKIKSDSTFSVINGGNHKDYKFNELVKGNGYQFKVSKGPAFKSDYPKIDVTFNDLYTLSEFYSLGGITVLPVIKDANTVLITLYDPVPQRGMDILNELITAYNQENVDSKNVIAKNTIAFIDKRLKYLISDLTGVEQDVERYKQVNRVTDINTDAQVNLQNSGNYDQQLAASRTQLDLINSVEDYLTQADTRNEQVPNTLGIRDGMLGNLMEKYNVLLIERQRLLRTNRAGNPLVVNVEDELSTLKQNILETLRNVRKGISLERGNLQARSNKYESMIRNVPVIERGLLERSREQSVKQNLYHYLLQKREETALSLSATVPTSKVISKPAYLTNPAKPKTTLIYLCAVLSGFILPVSVIYGRNRFNTKINHITDIQIPTGTKVLGELTHKEDRGTVVVKKGSRTTISELFRYIRYNLRHLDEYGNSQVLLITSTTKGEGKTFFTINLGITLSMVNKRVIILEFDLRKPDLLKGINLEQKQGITDYLERDDMDIDHLIRPSSVSPGLFVMGCGKIPADPADLLMSPKLDILFEELKKRFDYIIVDTSPVGHVADAFSLAKYTDSSIYLIRYNYTNKEQLTVLEDISATNKLKNMMLVFNDAKKDNKQAYSYGGYAYSEN